MKGRAPEMNIQPAMTAEDTIAKLRMIVESHIEHAREVATLNETEAERKYSAGQEAAFQHVMRELAELEKEAAFANRHSG